MCTEPKGMDGMEVLELVVGVGVGDIPSLDCYISVFLIFFLLARFMLTTLLHFI